MVVGFEWNEIIWYEFDQKVCFGTGGLIGSIEGPTKENDERGQG